MTLLEATIVVVDFVDTVFIVVVVVNVVVVTLLVVTNHIIFSCVVPNLTTVHHLNTAVLRWCCGCGCVAVGVVTI